MRNNRFALFGGCLLAALAWSSTLAQSAPSLQEQLNAQYKLARMSSKAGDWTVLEPGTTLDVVRAVAAVPPKSMRLCSSKFENGTLKEPGQLCLGMDRREFRYLTVGEKVYPVKLEVDLAKDKVEMEVVECDACNGARAPQSFRAGVTFQYGKGSLANTSAGQIEDAIGQVFAISNGESQPPPQAGGGQPPPDQPAEPQTIRIGMTIDQVVAAMGKPQNIVDLGAKQIYVYPNLKITFVNGKVTDVQ
jgi:hypothetical protein